MDNREFIVALDKLQGDYFAKLQALSETHKASLGPQYKSAMEQVLAEATAKIKATAGHAEALQEQVVNRAQKTLELIDSQAQHLGRTSSQVLQTAQEAAAGVATAEGQVAERLTRLVSLADSKSKEMVRKVDTQTSEAMNTLALREQEAAARMKALKQSANDAVHDVAQELKRTVGAWGTMVRWVTAPILIGVALGATVASGWAGKTYGEQVGYDQARSIARENVKNELAVNALALKPEFDPTSGAVNNLRTVILDKPIVIVDGQPRWMNHIDKGWVYGGLLLRDDWAVAEAWDSKDKDSRTLAKFTVSR